MINVYEILGAIFAVVFTIVFLQGIAEKTQGYLYLNYFIGGGGILLSGTPWGAIAYVFLLGIQTVFVVKGDDYWKRGVAIYVGRTDSFVRNDCAYEVKVRSGSGYIILQLDSGKTYYYEDVDEFLCFWKVSDEFYDVVEELGLVVSANKAQK